MLSSHHDIIAACYYLGAYIFRTSDTALRMIPPKATSVIVRETELVSEVHAKFSVDGGPMINQISRLVKGKNYVEVEYVVSPVPIGDGIGKEIISRFSTSIESRGTFFTDSNGREFLNRRRGDNKLYGTVNHDPVAIEPVAGNYYPVNAAVFIEDESRSFSVLLDRSQGASSLSDGCIELMIQRRLLHDDARGVAEALNETDVGITPNPPYGNATRLGSGLFIKGTHRLMIGEGMSGASQARSRMDETFSQPHIFVSSAVANENAPFQHAKFSAAGSPLPENVMLVTFASLREDGVFLIRLAHQYGADENSKYSLPVRVDLSVLFPTRTILSVREKTLSANQDRCDWLRTMLPWNGSTIGEPQRVPAKTSYRGLEVDGTFVEIKPLEILTFEVKVA